MNYKDETHLKKSEPQKKEEQDPLNLYPECKKKWDELASLEEKIALGIQIMKDALAEEGAPFFKKFWDIRKVTLPLFKESIDPLQRGKLWEEFTNVSTEARNLKALFDQKSSFALEQIGLAIESVESDVEKYEELLEKSQEPIFTDWDECLKERAFYEQSQKELQILNAFSARIASLRKELISTPMRLKQKNLLFKKLSNLSQIVLPKRKALMTSVSSQFFQEVEEFVRGHLGKNSKTPFHAIKKTIKILQDIAKKLTLTSKIFTESRNQLSQLWDEIKTKEKGRKEQILKRKEQSEENKKVLKEKISQLIEEKKDLTSKNYQNKVDALEKECKKMLFTREDQEEMDQELSQLIKTPLIKGFGEDLTERTLEKRIQTLVQEKETISLEDSYDRYEQLERQIDKEGASFKQKNRLREVLMPVQKWIDDQYDTKLQEALEKKELSLAKWTEFLEFSRKIRGKIKYHLEGQRKNRGNVGFDIQMAMDYQERLEKQRRRLEKIDQSITKIEEEIEDIDRG